ncbi:MAG: aromatic ring-hydroxylating dioxygenase subunit alpha [Proteobacteria bacterium]|nr:aromatic ring-hydroxylating dioxygenase subunit alpha [Pseudomonadota bacterium]
MNQTRMRDTRSIRELIACQRSGCSLEQRFYTDPEIYALELECIVMRNWIFTGHQSQLAEVGDYLVLNVAGESAIVVRSKQGGIKAFANVCRHRGSIVCLGKSGNKRKFECPYHGWMYDTDGNLIAARNMPEDFDRTSYGLHKVPVEIVHGLIFICFCDAPPSIEGARRDMAEPLAMFDFENLKVAAQKTYPISANWKLAVENYQECYHCAVAHPEYAKMHTLMLEGKRRQLIQSHMLENMGACGLKTIEIDYIDTKARPGETGFGYSRSALFEGYKTGSKDGQPVAPLLGNLTGYDGGASDITFGPFSFFLAYSDHVVGYVFTPVDAKNCQCRIYWLVRGDAVEGKDYDRDELMWLWDVTTCADKIIIVNNWKGINSKYYQPGPFSGMEKEEQRFVDWVLQELRRAPQYPS